MNAPLTAPTPPQRRQYKDKNGKRLPGVTTIIGETLGWSKSALMAWAHELGRQGRDYRQERDDAADAGTMAHAMIEAHLRGEQHEADALASAETIERATRACGLFLSWWPTSGFTAHLLEHALVDADAGYGGTVDLVLKAQDGSLVVADIKTGKSVYDEALIQLGAYTILLAKGGVQIAGGLIIHVPVEGETKITPISSRMLELGAASFTSLLFVYKMRPQIRGFRKEAA